MMNSEFIHERSLHFADRLIASTPSETERLKLAFQLAFSRLPTTEESQHAVDYFRQSQEKLAASGVTIGQLPREVWASYLCAVLASNEFIYID
jgi:hypothetical protein